MKLILIFLTLALFSTGVDATPIGVKKHLLQEEADAVWMATRKKTMDNCPSFILKFLSYLCPRVQLTEAEKEAAIKAYQDAKYATENKVTAGVKATAEAFICFNHMKDYEECWEEGPGCTFALTGEPCTESIYTAAKKAKEAEKAAKDASDKPATGTVVQATEATENGVTTEDTENGATVTQQVNYAKVNVATENGDAAENGVTTEATKNGVTAEATEHGVTTEATENGVTAEATKNGVTTEATKNGVTAEATENGVTTEATENGVTASKQVKYATDKQATEATKNGVTTEATENGVTAEATKNGVTTEATKNGVTAEATENGVTTEATENGVTASKQVKYATDKQATEATKNGVTTEATENGVTADYTTTAEAVKFKSVWLIDGESYRCDLESPIPDSAKDLDNVYRFMSSDRKLHLYPSNSIVDSWNVDRNSIITVTCPDAFGYDLEYGTSTDETRSSTDETSAADDTRTRNDETRTDTGNRDVDEDESFETREETSNAGRRQRKRF